MFKGLSAKAVVFAVITAVAALGAVAVLVVILTTGSSGAGKRNGGIPDNQDTGTIETGSDTVSEGTSGSGGDSESNNATDSGNDGKNDPAVNTPANGGTELTAAQLDAFWLRNEGYWVCPDTANPFDGAAVSNDVFVGFFKDGGRYRFEYGLYQSSYWFGGEVTKAKDMGDYRYEITIHFAATPATEIDEARPERDEVIYIHEVNVSSNIKIDNLGDGLYYSYIYGAPTLEGAFS